MFATKKVDSKGRVTLPEGFNGALVLIETKGDGEVRITKAAAIPEPEVWFWNNPEAIASVNKGFQDLEAKRVQTLALNEGNKWLASVSDDDA